MLEIPSRQAGQNAPLIFLPRAMRVSLLAAAIAVALGAVVADLAEIQTIPHADRPHFVWLTAYFFQAQDRPWCWAIAILLIALAGLPLPRLPLPRLERFSFSRRPRVIVVALALAVLVAGVFGSHFVFEGFHLSRDEVLADTDALIYRSGHVAAPIDAEWRPYASALSPRFMLPLRDGWGFVSDYLPVHALMRVLVGMVADPNWTSPILAVLAVLATFGAARRLWPTRPDAALVSGFLVASSSQVVVTSMTSYAMTAHLALNMIWLWLYLRDDRLGHAGAIFVGFLATGLHQLVFHPLFAAPFIIHLWRSERRRTALVYVLAYAAICIFWIAYLKPLLEWQGVKPDTADAAGVDYFLFRIAVVLSTFNWLGTDLMVKNAMRFIAWENPFLIPLALLSYPAFRQRFEIAGALLGGIVLTFVAMFVLLAYQGHGWGYRYMHGLIGNAALLGGYGWIALSQWTSRETMQGCKTAFAICAIFAVCVLLPAHVRQATLFTRPYIEALRSIAHSPSDIVIVDKSEHLFAEDLVRNDPFLRNTPKIMDLTNLSPADIYRLCERYSIAFFGSDQADEFKLIRNENIVGADDAQHRAVQDEIKTGCAHRTP